MDQVAIGQFIAQKRKEKNQTQQQLAETLGISNRTISKWEVGRGFPEVSLIQPLCQALDINVHELLSGQSLSSETDYQKAEVSILNLLEENQKKRNWAWSVFGLVMVTVVVLSLVTEYFEQRAPWIYWSLAAFIVLFVFAGIGIMLMIYMDAEIYRCRHCRTRFKPVFRDYFIVPLRILFRDKSLRRAFSTPWSRPLVCPNCQRLERCPLVLESESEEQDDIL